MTVNFKTAPFSPRLTSRARAVRVKVWSGAIGAGWKRRLRQERDRGTWISHHVESACNTYWEKPDCFEVYSDRKPVLTASQGTKASVCSKLRHNFITSFWKMKIFMVIRAQHRLILLSLKKWRMMAKWEVDLLCSILWQYCLHKSN